MNLILKVCGSGWSNYSVYHNWTSKFIFGDGLYGDSYPSALAKSKIALGLLGKHIPETTTTRTFEIPATGTFLLAERNDEHMSLFEEGKEAEFFDSDTEMIEKINFYLKNDHLRVKIARNGFERSVKSGYSNTSQMQLILNQVLKQL